MPELPCSFLVGPAISEPVQLSDGRILVAAETPARDKILVTQLFLPARLEDEDTVLTFASSTLPGGPTDNGSRAMWPRVSNLSGNLFVGWQQGENAQFSNFIDGHVNIGLPGLPAHGIWPVGVADFPDYYRVATPADGSQGIFGYFDSRWWTYDEMRESVFQQDWLKLGTLSHAWFDGYADHYLDHYLFKHESGTLLRTQSIARGSVVDRVFEGYAEYPRGCTLQDGRILVTAVGPRVREVSPGVWEHQLRVAISPFEPFKEEKEPMNFIGVVNWEPKTGLVAPSHISVLVGTDDNATSLVKRIRPKGQQQWVEEKTTVGVGRTLHTFRVNDPGVYQFMFVHPSGLETSIREFTVVAPPAPPAKPPQVITQADEDEFVAEQERMWRIVDDKLSYLNARCAGQTKDEALQTYREATSAAIVQPKEG